MKEPLVSIIAPVYRTPSVFLVRFVKSVLCQTCRDIELIAVDDASPDHCPASLDDLASRDSRMTVVHRKTNGRAGMARNDGLAIARGRYIHFADSDDLMQPDMCERLVQRAEDQHADLAACSWSIINDAGQAVGRGGLPDAVYNLKRPRDRAKAFRQMNYALWNKLFRRETIAPLRFESFEANIGEDTLFNVAALSRGRRMVSMSYTGYSYTLHAGSATGRTGKGMAYLSTIVLSTRPIRDTLGESGARSLADQIALNRFTTGCGWIADNPDSADRAELWTYWRAYLKNEVLPGLISNGWCAAVYRAASVTDNPKRAYRLTRFALKLSTPGRLIDGAFAKCRLWRPLA